MSKNKSNKNKLFKVKKVEVGDLVALLSSVTGEIIDEYPYGIILEKKKGIPSDLSDSEKKRDVASVLFDGCVEELVDITWLLKID
jgi:hypothetical protein